MSHPDSDTEHPHRREEDRIIAAINLFSATTTQALASVSVKLDSISRDGIETAKLVGRMEERLKIAESNATEAKAGVAALNVQGAVSRSQLALIGAATAIIGSAFGAALVKWVFK